jgi:hypothetical protein
MMEKEEWQDKMGRKTRKAEWLAGQVLHSLLPLPSNSFDTHAHTFPAFRVLSKRTLREYIAIFS